MKIAIIGTGIAGNVAAYHLNKHHQITVFEAEDYTGGHTHTHDVVHQGNKYSIDTGFIVFNYNTYPQFTRLLKELDVAVQPSTMSFSVKCQQTGLEYNGTTLNSLFAQRSNLLRPSFFRMIKDVLRFNRQAVDLMNSGQADMSLGEFLKRGGYGEEFIHHYLIPMGAAVWSTKPSQMIDFPAGFFIRFFHNHGMLSVNERPLWYVIKGGSREYVKKLTKPFAHCIQHHALVEGILRYQDHVDVKVRGKDAERFDQVFIATHSDQALNMLSDASKQEEAVLGALPYQKNEAVLHTDASILPKRRLAWAGWNYHLQNHHLPSTSNHKVALTYNMNILQGLDAREQFCVTLNNSEAIDPNKIIKRLTYAHPLFTPEGVNAQKQQADINGVNRTYFCGAYWRYGFHEDGVISALNALYHFKERNDGQLYLRRAG